MSKKVRIGMIGYKFMGRAHSLGYRSFPIFFKTDIQPILKVICGRNEEAVRHAAKQFGWEEYETDWKKVVSRDDIDLIDICTPNSTHKEIAIAAAEAGKHIICEKPLATDLDEALAMLKAVERAGVKHMVAFTFRHIPAVALAKQLLEKGKLGEIYHWRGRWLADWLIDPEAPLEWHSRKGGGQLLDVGSHVVDMCHYLLGNVAGPIERVVGQMETFIKERPLLENPTQRGPVEVDDATIFLARFKNGATGVFELSRVAAGNDDRQSFEINGSEGSLRFDYDNMNRLEYYSRHEEPATRAFRTIRVGNEAHPYRQDKWGGVGSAGHGDGYGDLFIYQAYKFMEALFASDRDPSVPTFEDGVRTHAVFEAVKKSVEEEKWVEVEYPI